MLVMIGGMNDDELKKQNEILSHIHFELTCIRGTLAFIGWFLFTMFVILPAVAGVIWRMAHG